MSARGIRKTRNHRLDRGVIFLFLAPMVLGACFSPSQDQPAPQNTPTPAAADVPEELRQVAIFQLRVLCAGLVIYRLHVERFPDAVEGIQVLWTAPADDLARERWRGPYIPGEDMMLDPWGRPFAYGPEDSPALFDLRSLGPDGIMSNDDIVAAQVMPEFFTEIREELARSTPTPALPTPQKQLQ